MVMRENELEFDFLDLPSERLDNKDKAQPQGLQLVDFLVEEPDRLIMVEIKDPSCKPKGNDEKALADIKTQRQKFVAKINNGDLINHELAPKARDSYTYIHLMARDVKPILYVFVLGADKLSLEDSSLIQLRADLLTRLRQEADKPWARKYVVDCLVLTEKTWPLAFPQYALTRIS
ncbi:MAG: hypothetical protein DM484_19315 [Candidatus Methylumidiphilus alinenensis]|uniref:Uncharacterized protein n=1 Tax=Candidatus Methylumidiphilus alinenensis TaxID=2202197 RepID=A0A2W4QTQ9_9GAMM|nr:MAG: hypothetical protein DM484_19315 [Candidatus Methylumidiphilus alinenensis]